MKGSCHKIAPKNSFLKTTTDVKCIKFEIQTIVNMLLGQAYYTGNQSSPVYSMASDVHRLYVALDMGLNMMDFSVR